MKETTTWVAAAAGAAAMLTLAGCTATEQGTATGAVVGGAVGAIAGNNFGGGAGDRDKAALIGAGVGALVGNQMGAQKDRQNQLDQRLSAVESQSQQETVWISNPNGSKTSVTLKKGAGDTWIGPNGEVYNGKPTEAQLAPVYGLK